MVRCRSKACDGANKLEKYASVDLTDLRNNNKLMSMKIKKLSHNEFSKLSAEFHCLTYAEEGFAPLNQFTKSFGIDAQVLKEFADAINTRDEAGSLYPKAPVSCVPRNCVRETYGYKDLKKHIQTFLDANRKSIRSKYLVIDFGVPRLNQKVWYVLDDMDHEKNFDDFDQVIVIDDDQ